jgi:hypothetical protein
VLRILTTAAIAGLPLFISFPAFSCSCVYGLHDNARTEMSYSSVVFRGTVLRREILPLRLEMMGRGRYAITFQVDQFWKGSPGRSITIYGVDGGTDCLGGGGYEVGRNYLVYVSEVEVSDVGLEEHFLYGWTDLLPKGSKMLAPSPCVPHDEERKALRTLGKGRAPARTN